MNSGARAAFRAIILAIGGIFGGGFALLGVLILITGRAEIPVIRGPDFKAVGFAAYAMGVGWFALGIAMFCSSLISAEVGSRYYFQRLRDIALLIFGAGLLVAVLVALWKEYGSFAL